MILFFQHIFTRKCRDSLCCHACIVQECPLIALKFDLFGLPTSFDHPPFGPISFTLHQPHGVQCAIVPPLEYCKLFLCRVCANSGLNANKKNEMRKCKPNVRKSKSDLKTSSYSKSRMSLEQRKWTS